MDRVESEELRQCIAECDTCRDTCARTIAHCLRRGGRHAAADHMLALLDCVDMCAISSGFMLRGSSAHARVCGLCAEICDACARACESFDDDHVMRRCAEECRRCAASCRAMVASETR
jgi:hypothetical protein